MCATKSADMQHPLFSLCVEESGAVYYAVFDALRGLLSGVCVSEGKFTRESSFVIFPWSSPCVLTSEGHLQRD